MPRIVWDETFSVKVPEIDQQHRRWIEITNNLHEILIEGKGLRGTTQKTLNDMIEYVRFHFSFEEEYMQKIGYSRFAAHKILHDEFMEKIVKLRKDEMAGLMVLNTEVMKVLKDWLQNHILTEDKKITNA